MLSQVSQLRLWWAFASNLAGHGMTDSAKTGLDWAAVAFLLVTAVRA
jgi:hypothetical protein